MQFEPHGAPAVVLTRGPDEVGNGSEHPMSMTSHVNASTMAPENVGNKSAVRKHDPHKFTTIDANLSGYVGHGDDIPQVLFAEGAVQNVSQDVHAVRVHNQVASKNGVGRPTLSHSEAQGGTASTSSLADLQTHAHPDHMQESHVGSVAHAGLWLDPQPTQPDGSVTCAVLPLETQTRQPENSFFVAGPQNTSFDTPHNDMAKVMDELAMPVEARQPDITAAANDATSCGLDDMAKLKNGSVVAQIIRAQPVVTSPVAGLEDASFDACHDDLTEPVDGLAEPLVEDKNRLKNTRSAVQSAALDTGMALPKDGSPTPAVPLVETQTRQPLTTPAVAASQNAASDTELYNVTMPIDGSVTPAASSVEVQIRKPGIIPDVEGPQTAKSDTRHDDTTLRIDGSVTSVAPLIETQTSQSEQPGITSPIQGLQNALEDTPVANLVLLKNGLFSVIAPLIEGKLPLVENAGDIFSNNHQDHSLREVIPVTEISVQELQISGSLEHSWILTAHKDGQGNEPKQRSDDEGSGAVERKESEATLAKEIKAKEVEEDSKSGALQSEATGTHMQALGEDDKQDHTDVVHKARDTIVGQEDTGDLIGRAITKHFGKKDFSGVAISYDTEHNWYKVVYEDGDQEDLEKAEVEALLLPLDYSSAVPSCKRQPVVEERESKERKKLKGGTLATEGKKRSKKALTEAHSPEHSGGRSSVDKDKEGKASMKPFLPENESKKLTGTKKGLVPLKGLERSSSKVSKAGKKKTSENEIDDGGKSNFQERRRSGTGITLQEGIKRYLQKREDTGQSPTSKGVKRKVESEETKSPKHKLLKFGITENPRSASMKSNGKTAVGCPMPLDREAVEPGATLVGSPTRKKFGGQYYSGNVISYNEDTKLYMIRYEDGDEEDLEWRDLKPTLASVRKQYSPVKLKRVKKSTSGSRGKAAGVQVGAALIGTPIRKKFGKKFYAGTVVSYDKKTQFYQVNYEDGDQEDLEWSELEPTLLEWRQGITHSELGDSMNTELEPSQVSERKQIISAKLKGSDAKTRREDGVAGIGDCLIGSSTWKKFGRKFYAGNVISYNKKTNLYKVTYEDGDQEDLEWSELEPTLVLDWQQGTTLGASKFVGDYIDSELEPSWVSERRQGSSAKLKGSNVKSRREQGDAGIGTFLIGSSTRKKFGRKFYTGNVISYDKKTKLYKVRYEDGDEEGLEWSELEPTLVSEGKLATPVTAKLGEHQDGSSLVMERKQQDPLAKSNSVKGSKSNVKSEGKTCFELGAVAVGKSTRKKFAGRFYNGNVVSYNRRTKFYKVSYEDGDQEDLEWSQLEPTLVVKEKQDTLAKGFSSKSRGTTGLRQH